MSPPDQCRLARRGLLSAVLGAFACVVVAAPVYAFASRRTHVAIVPPADTIATTAFGSSTATCPTGQHVLFGGFDGGEAGMRRTANDRWTVDTFNLPVPDVSPSSISVSSMAYCGYGPVASKATSTVEIRYRSPSPASGAATARCPAGTVVVAGGFASTPHSVVFATGLERVAADLWRVSARLLFGTHTALTSIAYCGPGPAPKLVSRTIKTIIGGTARATCPVGTTLAFGGGVTKASGSNFTFLRTLRADTRSTWSVGGYTGGGKLTALAYCR
jgi:hypothetical protein